MEREQNSVGGGVPGKSEQRQDSNVSLSPQPRAESSYFAISKLIRVLDSFKSKKGNFYRHKTQDMGGDLQDYPRKHSPE